MNILECKALTKRYGGKVVAGRQGISGGGRGSGKGGGSESHEADDGESIGLHLFSMVGLSVGRSSGEGFSSRRRPLSIKPATGVSKA